MTTRRILLATLVLAVALAGAVVALEYLGKPTGGHLVKTVTDVTLTTVAPPPTTAPATTSAPTAIPTRPRPKPPPVDRRCWKMFGGGPSRSLARLDIDLGIPTKPLWARGLKSYVEYPPTYCDGVVYVNTYAGDTWALEARTGRVIWRRRDTSPKPASPAIAGPYLITPAKDGTVTALDRSDGRVVWQLRLRRIVESSPAVVDGIVYFGVTDGRLFAVSAADGHIIWAYDTGGRINSSPSIAGDRIFISTYAGSILALRRSDGAKIWSTFVRRRPIGYESFYASVSTDGERLYTIARSGKIVALSADDGRVFWTDSVKGWGYSTPSVGRDRVFVGGFDGALHAFDKVTGKRLWQAQVGGRVLGGSVVIGNLVFFSTLETETYAARVSDGKVVWHYPIGKYSPGIATERAYYFTLNGIIVALRGERSPR